MQTEQRPTLTQFLIDERRRFPEAGGDFNSVILNVALVCRRISHAIACGELAGVNGSAQSTNVQGEDQKKLDILSNDLFIEGNQWGGQLAGMVSEELDEPYSIPKPYKRGPYLLLFDPLDGSSNIDVNVAVGSIFSVLRTPDLRRATTANDYLQPGVKQVAAGYAIYGPATMLVLSVGNGVHAFTLCPQVGEFMLTHPNLTIPQDTSEFAINTSNSRFWGEPVRRYVDECIAGKTGERGKDFNMRWIASLVAEAHRILMRGGVFLYPRDNKQPARKGRLRLLYEANPIGFIMEQAGGRASTGHEPVLQVEPADVHERIGFIFGSRNEVERIEQYHKHPRQVDSPNPLFHDRSLFTESTDMQ